MKGLRMFSQTRFRLYRLHGYSRISAFWYAL